MLCLVCPAYTPADDDRSREILGDRIVERANRKLVKIERATPQHSISECTGMNVEYERGDTSPYERGKPFISHEYESIIYLRPPEILSITITLYPALKAWWFSGRLVLLVTITSGAFSLTPITVCSQA
jgi:transposase InsO family protein